MKPLVKQKIAFFSPVGFIDGENAVDIVSPQDIDYLIRAKLEGSFISLKKVIFFNKRGITLLIESLQKVKDECGTVIGFCDYDIKKYKMILDMFPENLNFSLFDTIDIVTLFVGDDLKSAKDKNILIYVSKNEQKNQLAMELYERGLSPIVAKNESDFLEKRNDAEFVIENAYLGKLDKTPTVYIKDNVIVYTLKGFVDSSFAKKFDMLYHINSLKVGFKIFLFDCDAASSVNVHGVNFICKLSTAGAEYGAVVVMTGLNSRKVTDKLSNDLEDAGVLVYPDMKALFSDDEIMKEAHDSSSVAKKNKGITKKLVSSLSVIIESTVKTIEVLSGYNTNKNSIKIQPLSILNPEKVLSVSLGLYGDVEGVFILVFEKTIAKKACKILLEEDSEESDVLEALGEFIHIIGGKISQQLQKKNIKIDVTMPRTFDCAEDLLVSQKETKGAQVDLSANGENLIIFLTR